MSTQGTIADAEGDIAALVYASGDRPDLVLRDFAKHLAGAGHLRERVLQGNAVGIEIGVASASLDPRCRPGEPQMVHEDLLRQRQRTAELLSAQRGAGRELPVDPLDEPDGGGSGGGHARPLSLWCRVLVYRPDVDKYKTSA